ncbi:hypothetical protein CLU79DRAFT_779695, partial [Phycomyces nitens]
MCLIFVGLVWVVVTCIFNNCLSIVLGIPAINGSVTRFIAVVTVTCDLLSLTFPFVFVVGFLITLASFL